MSKRDRDYQSAWDQCNSYDRLDGCRYVGYYRREYNNSRFGSHPSYDDYSENSFPGKSKYEER